MNDEIQQFNSITPMIRVRLNDRPCNFMSVDRSKFGACAMRFRLLTEGNRAPGCAQARGAGRARSVTELHDLGIYYLMTQFTSGRERCFNDNLCP